MSKDKQTKSVNKENIAEGMARRALDLAQASIEKNYGKGSIMWGDATEPFDQYPSIPTGSLGLDKALGIGGIPEGRIIEIYGPESCLDKDTFISYEIWKNEKRVNHKGGSIERLYERFCNIELEDTPKQGRHLQVQDADFYVKSVNDEGRVLRNKILDVVATGEKECFKVITSDGQTLIATGEHKFLTPSGYVKLDDLNVLDEILVHNNTRVIGRQDYQNRQEINVKYHPNWPTKIVHDKKTGNDYLYYRGQFSRFIYEAFLNGLEPEEYREILNTSVVSDITKLRFLPSHIHIHHEDEDFENNNINNLKLIDPSVHGRLHARDRIRNLSFVAVPATITEKQLVGKRHTYDIRCAYPYNNYIANGIVVHNSGKTTLALQMIAQVQSRGGIAAFIDMEHALDKKYARNLGVKLKDMMISQPDNAEEALEIIDILGRCGGVDIIVLDSVAALVPKAELDGNMGDSLPGLQARMMSQALRKLTAICAKTNTNVIFINQIRYKIGIMFGNPETTTGGNALKFYASVRLDIRRIGAIKRGEEIVGNRTRVKVVKNKMAPPFQECEFDIVYGKGIDFYGEVVDKGVADGLITKSGAWYSIGEERLAQGRDNAIQNIIAWPELVKMIAGEHYSSQIKIEEEDDRLEENQFPLPNEPGECSDGEIKES